jgi:hypothetical protein
LLTRNPPAWETGFGRRDNNLTPAARVVIGWHSAEGKV